MTQDDRSTTPQGGLPADSGNGMSDRAGWTDDSESGMTDTSITTGDAVLTPEPTEADDSTGTTFGTAGTDDRGT